MSRGSELAFAFIVIDGQLSNAITEERRWRLREQEAQEMRLHATRLVRKWSADMAEIKREMTYA